MKGRLVGMKLREWGSRYIPSEVLGTVCALLFAGLAEILTGNGVVAAYSGTWGENLGYMSPIYYRDLKARSRRARSGHRKLNRFDVLKVVRNITVEFGPSGLLDSFVTRPFLMYALPVWLGNFYVGIVAGKLAADVIFYLPTIVSYELRKKYLRD